ncbi:MAG: cyclic nucleotide-binding domain-containing protein [Actinobacteria bacterium]|nr:MAG: cyclic nucleotide-binding domain-containing protein [Actinomycetota bacterium]
MPKRDVRLEMLAQVPMFSACSKRELQLIARRADPLDIDKGQVLVKEGTTGHEFFVIIHGKAKVTRRGRQVAVLGPGNFFGELALLDTAPRNASVTAQTPMEVLVLGQREFSGLLAEVPAMSTKVMKGMARRLHELDAKA